MEAISSQLSVPYLSVPHQTAELTTDS